MKLKHIYWIITALLLGTFIFNPGFFDDATAPALLAMGFATHTTTFVNTPVEKLFRDLVIGSQTLDKGVAQTLQGFRKDISLNRFFTTGDNITAPPATGKYTVANDSFNKDEVALLMEPLAWYNEYNARDFNIDHKFLWTQGKDGMIQPSAKLTEAVTPSVVENFNNELDRILWQEAAAGLLGAVGGLEAQLVADATVIPVTPTVLTAANIIEQLELYIAAAAATNPAILELGNPGFVVSNLTMALYREAARALPNKGTDITEQIAEQYGGYPITSVNGMSADKIFFGNVGGGESAEIKVGVWMANDRTSVELGRTAPMDETFFVKVNTEIGVAYVYGKQIVYTKA